MYCPSSPSPHPLRPSNQASVTDHLTAPALVMSLLPPSSQIQRSILLPLPQAPAALLYGLLLEVSLTWSTRLHNLPQHLSLQPSRLLPFSSCSLCSSHCSLPPGLCTCRSVWNVPSRNPLVSSITSFKSRLIRCFSESAARQAYMHRQHLLQPSFPSAQSSQRTESASLLTEHWHRGPSENSRQHKAGAAHAGRTICPFSKCRVATSSLRHGYPNRTLYSSASSFKSFKGVVYKETYQPFSRDINEIGDVRAGTLYLEQSVTHR